MTSVMVVAACFDVRPKVAVASNLLAGQLLTDHAWAGIRADRKSVV